MPPGRQVGVTDQVLDPDLAYTGSIHSSRATLASQKVEDSLAIATWMRGKVGAACLGRTPEAVEDLRAKLMQRVGADLATSAPVEVR